MKRRTVEAFAIAYFNGEVKPNLSEKDPMSGREVEFLMDAPQFDKVNRAEVWSHSTAVGTGYQYRVVYKDKRFSGLAQLLAMYSGSIPVADSDKPAVEQRLYEVVLLLIRERRLPSTFKLQPAKDQNEAKVEGLQAEVSRLGQIIDALEKRVKVLESSSEPEEPQAVTPEPIPSVAPPPSEPLFPQVIPDPLASNS